MSTLDRLLGPGVVTTSYDGSLRLNDAALGRERHRRPQPGEPFCRCPVCKHNARAGEPAEQTCAHCHELTRPIAGPAGKPICPWCETPMPPGRPAPEPVSQPWEPKAPRAQAA